MVKAYYYYIFYRRMVNSANVAALAIARKALDSLALEFGFVAYFVDPVKLSTRFQNSSSCSFSNETSLDDAPVVAPLSFDEFQHLFKERKLDGVVWNNTLVVNWEPYQAHYPSNLSNGLLMDGDFLLASTKTGSGAVESFAAFAQSKTLPICSNHVHFRRGNAEGTHRKTAGICRFTAASCQGDVRLLCYSFQVAYIVCKGLPFE